MQIIWLKTKQALKRFWGTFRSRKISLIDERDFENFLTSIGELDRFSKNVHNCLSCGKAISYVNCGAVYRNGNHYQFLCNEPSCVIDFVK